MMFIGGSMYVVSRGCGCRLKRVAQGLLRECTLPEQLPGCLSVCLPACVSAWQVQGLLLECRLAD